MAPARPNKTQYVPCEPLHDALLPLNPILRPDFSLNYSPRTGLILAGTIAGLAQWYEDDKLQDQEPDWLGLAVPCELATITGMYLSRVHHVAAYTRESSEWFFETALDDLETWPVVDYEAETVSWRLNPDQCAKLLIALAADSNNYDPVRAAEPAFPPIQQRVLR